MFKIKYNIIIIIQIILGIINYILLLKTFGVSVQSDSYLLSISALTLLFSLITLPIGQFMQYYNDAKVVSVKRSQDFYNGSIIFAIIIGVFFSIFLHILMPVLIKLFAYNIDADRYNLFKSLLDILLYGLILYPVNQINSQLFNAEGKFSLPYILSIIPTLLVVLVQVIMIFNKSPNIMYLAIAQSFGLLMIAILGTSYIFLTIIRFKFVLCPQKLFSEIKNSSIMYSGSIIWSSVSSILFNNFLVLFPTGYISYFYYAKKILDICNSITIGPSSKILNANISKYISQGKKDSIYHDSKKFIKVGGILFCVIIICAYFIQPLILNLITSNKFNSNDIRLIQMLFLILCPWYLIMFMNQPFASITHMAKRAKESLLTDITFLLLSASLLFLTRPFLGIFSLGIATSFAQLANFILYIIFSKRVMKQLLHD